MGLEDNKQANRVQEPGSRLDEEKYWFVRDCIRNGQKPASIYADATQRFGYKPISLGTIKHMYRKYRDLSGPWDFTEADPEDAKWVLPVLGQMILATGGKRVLTVGDAAWIARIGKTGLVQDMPLDMLYRLAQAYRAREVARELPADNLDAFLACGPWRDREVYGAFMQIKAAGGATGDFAQLLFLCRLYISEEERETNNG